jgi:hypothetical protein
MQLTLKRPVSRALWWPKWDQRKPTFEQGEIGPDLFRKACEFGLEGLIFEAPGIGRTAPAGRPWQHHREVITMSTLLDSKHWHCRAKVTRSEAEKFGDGNEKKGKALARGGRSTTV